MIDAEATRATGDDNSRLKRDAGALLDVAGEIDAAQLTDPNRLDRALVTVQADLGRHHDLRAAEAWARRDTLAAGRSLAAAARYVDRAWGSSGEKVPVQVMQGLPGVEGVRGPIAEPC